MIIAKFGGTSVSSKKSILTLCQIINSEINRQPVVVVSALSGVTNLLLSLPTLPKTQLKKELKRLNNIHINLIENLWEEKELKKEAIKYINKKVAEVSSLIKKQNVDKPFLDRLASFGEIMSSYIVAKALNKKGIKAQQVISEGLIITNDNFTAAEFLPKQTQRNVRKILIPIIKRREVAVVTGFIGSTKNGQITTLGRGGSDYTASIIGFCLGALEIQIWSDVDGMFTADPHLVKNARLLSRLSFREASELATFGARVLHPRTIRPAIKAGIPVKILNTFNPKSPGSLIQQKNGGNPLKAVSFKRKIMLVNIYSTEMLLQKGFLSKIFQIFASNNISVDLVSVSEVSVSVTLDNNDGLAKTVNELSKIAAVSVIEDLGLVSLIGEGITTSAQTISRIFNILEKEKILVRMLSLGATNINISMVVKSQEVEQAVLALHKQLLLKQKNLKNNGTISPK